MKVFLTGDRQVGKSTVLRKVLSRLPQQTVGGYYTRAAGQDILMISAALPEAEGFSVGRRRQSGYPEVFDTKGAELLRSTADCSLVVLDEIGWMERDAGIFSAEVLRIVQSGKNVLGVMRKNCDTPLCNALRAAEGVEIIEVTAENREELAKTLGEKFVQEFREKQGI